MYTSQIEKNGTQRIYNLTKTKNMSYLHNSTWIGIKNIILSENREMDIPQIWNSKSSHKIIPYPLTCSEINTYISRNVLEGRRLKAWVEMVGADGIGNAGQWDWKEKSGLRITCQELRFWSTMSINSRALKHVRCSPHKNTNTKHEQHDRAWQPVETGFKLRSAWLQGQSMLWIYFVSTSSNYHLEESKGEAVLKDEVSARAPSQTLWRNCLRTTEQGQN